MSKHKLQARSLEPISRVLIRQLLVPHIYFEPTLANFAFDLLALDRAGTGEAHGLRLYEDLSEAISSGASEMFSAPAHYRWIAYLGEGLGPRDEHSEILLRSQEPLFPVEGMGRIGVIEVVAMTNNDLGANIRVKAERFKTRPELWELLETFKSQKPDIQFSD